MARPRAEIIPRTGSGTGTTQNEGVTVAWTDLEARLGEGGSTAWLSVRARRGGVHTRPIFAAWTGDAIVFTTNGSAAKTADLEHDGQVSLAIDLGSTHLIIEGLAERKTETPDLERASTAMLETFEWPTEVVGDELDAPYAAPTSGGPPFQVWELAPAVAIALPTNDAVEPTRFVFD